MNSNIIIGEASSVAQQNPVYQQEIMYIIGLAKKLAYTYVCSYRNIEFKEWSVHSGSRVGQYQ